VKPKQQQQQQQQQHIIKNPSKA